ncbi:hypothetical protein BGX29_006704 [Mortierella sp. GBA35]|nr:hypothetical protein BGX29_006704 [Mortierella sp. GBA35]
MAPTIYASPRTLVLNSILLILPTTPSVDASLWPKPAYDCYGHHTVQVPTTFTFDLPDDSHSILVEGAARYRERILTGNFISPVPVDPTQVALEDRSQIGKLKLESLSIEVEDQKGELLIAQDDDPNTPFELDAKTCAELTKQPIEPGFKSTLKAKTYYGALRGLETFAQLVTKNRQDGVKEVAQAPIIIHNRPLFSFHGVLLDNAGTISHGQHYKDNRCHSDEQAEVFHWHITDAPSFLLLLDDQLASDDDNGTEIDFEFERGQDGNHRFKNSRSRKVLPFSQLAKRGAYSEKMVYTKAEISKFVNYAITRGVRVVSEIDMPGHAWSWSVAFPEITTCVGGFPYGRPFVAEPPSEQLNPVHPKTYMVVQGT